jgi:hypothetical protein
MSVGGRWSAEQLKGGRNGDDGARSGRSLSVTHAQVKKQIGQHKRDNGTIWIIWNKHDKLNQCMNGFRLNLKYIIVTE